MRMGLMGVAALVLLTGGCASLDSAGIAYNDDSKLFVWKSNYSAGIGTDKGICAQAATTIQANNTQLDVQASDRLLSSFNPALLTQEQSSELIDLGIEQMQTIGTTNVSNGQTAYANIAFFYLCQISLNTDLEDETIAQMWQTTTESMTRIGHSGNLSTIKPDELGDGED